MWTQNIRLTHTHTHTHTHQVQRGGQQAGGPLFQKLMKHVDEMFARDFPFYLLVAYRVHKYMHR